MEDRYYNPKIDEFHVGFEYEHLLKDNFTGCTILCYPDIEDVYYDIPLNKIRVKHLDSSDIESFGFKFDATRSKVDGNFVGSYENEKYYLDYSPYSYGGEFNSSVHLRVMKIKDIPITSYQSNYQFIYDGIIKNKSELKKLLIQLEIINE